jgi:uncharacterized protein YdaU (DUF1376 family)
MSGNHIPYFNFYASDFMNGVRGMTSQEVGVYVMLLCRIYEESGPVECNELILATYCGMRIATFRKSLEKLVALGKLYEADGMISNRRAEVEISKRAESLKNNSRAGKASAKKRQQKQRAVATPVERPFNHTDTDTDTDTDTEVLEREAKASPKNGARLSPDWFLPASWGQWALDEGGSQDLIRSEADKFKDYWIGVAGAKARKADWEATWRNWIRKAIADKAPKFTAITGGQNGKPATKSQQRMDAFLRGAQITS